MAFDDHLSGPTPPADDEPDWTIISIADHAGAGADAAFTDGLAGVGLPELALGARPSEGDDPGADWLLTHEERMMQLDEWANDLVQGLLAPDDVQRRHFDHGHTTVTFRFAPPVTAQQAGIHALPPERPVIVVAWSLSRRTTPRAPDPSSAAVRRVDRWRSRARAVMEHELRSGQQQLAAPGGRAQRFGPMTPWVMTRVDQLQAARESTLHAFFTRIPMVSLVSCEHCTHQGLMRLASRSGRGGPAREALNAAELLLPGLTGISRAPCADDLEWPADDPYISVPVAWGALVEDVGQALPLALHCELQAVMQQRLCTSLEILLVAAVVADLAPQPLMATACGPWEWAISGGRVPGRAWLAPPEARAATRLLLTRPDGSSALGAPLDGARYDPLDDPRYDPLDDPLGGPLGGARYENDPAGGARSAGVIGGLQTATRASAHPGWLLTGEQRAGLDRRQVRHAEQLAAPLLAAVAQPTRLHPDTWLQVTARLRPFVPELPPEPPPIPNRKRHG